MCRFKDCNNITLFSGEPGPPGPPGPPGSSGIGIPQLNIQSKSGQKLFASILPGTYSNDYLAYNPKIFLFVKKNGKKRMVRDINGNAITKYYLGGWKHTTHMQGINFPNNNFYSGTTSCPTHSEFPLTVTNPYEFQELTDFNPGEFYVYYAPGYNLPVAAPLLNTIPWSQRNNIAVRGRNENYARSTYFRFAIGIENPDTTSPQPILFGPMTSSIQCKIVKARLGEEDLVVSYALNHDPTNIKAFYAQP